MPDERSQRRVVFDGDALLYDRVRPGYPPAMFDDIAALAGLPAGGRVLEVGPGTGQITLPLARRGYRIDAIELGANMAAVARARLAGYPLVTIHVGAFEALPVAEAAYDLLISGTAFHWVDPEVRFQRAAAALRPGGTLALCWNKHVQSPASRGFFEAAQSAYRSVLPPSDEPWEGLPDADTLPEPERDEIAASGLFGPVAVRKYRWDQDYTAAEYIDLLNTYSDHRSLPPPQRQRLFGGLAELIDREYGGRITKGYLTVLYCAPRLVV
jgi:SAM-dependent methyltransferase